MRSPCDATTVCWALGDNRTEFQRTCKKFDAGAWARDQQMSSLELLVDRLLTENICRPTLSDALALEVVTWIGKSTKINVSDCGFGIGSWLRHSAGGAHRGHCMSDGQWGGLDAGR